MKHKKMKMKHTTASQAVMVLPDESGGASKEFMFASCFVATHHNTDKFERTTVSKCGTITTVYRAFDNLSTREMINTLAIVKAVYNFKNIKIGKKRTVIQISAREMLKATGVNLTKTTQRKALFESLSRVANMSYIETTKTDNIEKAKRRQWFYDVTSNDNYETIEVEISSKFLHRMVDNGAIDFDFKNLVSIKDPRYKLFWTFMQQQKYLSKKHTQYKKYVYADYFNHSDLCQALDIQRLHEKRQALILKGVMQTFKDDTGLMYKPYLTLNGVSVWKKVSKYEKSK